MGYILNASEREQSFKVFGNHFSLKPGQTKHFGDSISHFMATDKAYLGLVSLPEEFSDPSFKDSEEGKQIFESAKKAGIDARCKHLREIVYNLEVSLKKDLEQKNLQMDSKVLASDGDVEVYKELASYKRKEADEGVKRATTLAKLSEEITE